jgi:uncharacterized protein (DUF58 family)
MNLVLDPKEFRLLEGLRLNPRKTFGGKIRGERLTSKKGVSIEFADYREYSEGDDLRHLDWNVLARLDVPVMRTYQDEEDLPVHILLDTSPSMSFGEPSKADLAQKCALALGYVALVGGDTVYPRTLARISPRSQPLRGRAAFPRLAAWTQSPSMTQDSLAVGLRGFANTSVRTGVVVLLSDGLDPDAPTAIRMLAGRGHELLFLQLLSDLELDPDLEGDLRLIDDEGGKPVEITVNGAAIKEYRKRLADHNAALHEAVLKVGGRHHIVTSSSQFSSVVNDVWKREGWVR